MQAGANKAAGEVAKVDNLAKNSKRITDWIKSIGNLQKVTTFFSLIGENRKDISWQRGVQLKEWTPSFDSRLCQALHAERFCICHWCLSSWLSPTSCTPAAICFACHSMRSCPIRKEAYPDWLCGNPQSRKMPFLLLLRFQVQS